MRAGDEEIKADAVLIATGALPRVLPGAEPDGEAILTWRQLYDLTEIPRDLIVVGSGVTGAEFASAYQALGSRVTLVSSRDRVLPQEDEDAASLIEDVFRRSGMRVLGRSRAQAVRRDANSVTVLVLDNGRTVTGSHCLLTVGMIPRTEGCGLDEAGVKVDARRLHRGGPGVPDVGARRIRGGELHRRADPGLGRRHAGPDRHVAHARRGGGAAAARPRRGDHLHRSGDRHRRRSRSARSPRARSRPGC